MSRRFTSLLVTLLLLLGGATSVSAQLDELKGKAINVGPAVAEFEPNTWYLLYQGRVSGADPYDFPAPGEIPTSGGFLWEYYSLVNYVLQKLDVSTIDPNSMADEDWVAGFLVRFIPTGTGEDTYNIQFGSGHWMRTATASSGESCFSTTADPFGAAEFNLYQIDPANPGNFGFNVAPYGARIDNNGNGGWVVPWDSGKHSADLTDGKNSIWNIVSIDWVELSEKEMAYNRLQNVYAQYGDYYDSFTPGTEPGQYGEAEVAAFRAALDAVAAIDGPEGNYDEMTAEDFDRLATAIEEAYKAVMESYVNLSLANGYYRIKTGGLAYTETQTNEAGESVTVTVDKYMYVSENGTTLNGVWGSVEDLTTHAPSLWKLTAKGEGDGTYILENVAFDAQFNKATATSANFTLQTDSAEVMYVSLSPREDRGDDLYVNIRAASQTDTYVYLHQGGHNNGAGKSGNIVAWSAGPSASEWELIAVSDEDAQAIIDAYAPIKDRVAMLAAYDSIMTNAKANLEIARDLQKIVHNEEGEELITSDDQFSSPYTETSEGSITGTLLDNSTAVESFWHSNWQDGSVAMDVHYLQVELTDTDIEAAVAVIGRRSNATNDHVTAMNVRGTNDPDAEKADCELLGNIKTPFGARGEMGVVSDVFEVKGYKYLRFYPTTTVGEGGGINNRGYFHLAEFQLYPADVYQSETAQSIMLGDLYTNLEAVVNAQKGMEEEDIQLDDYNALKEAYDAFMTKFVDPTELRNTMKDKENVLATIRTGKNDPGFWTNANVGDTFKATYDAAQAYDAAGVYTTEQSADYVEKLNQQSEDIYASAIQIQEGKWYRIRYALEEDFDNNDWEKVGDATETIPELYGKYVSVANQITEDGVQYIESIEAEYVALGHTLHLLAEGDITYADNALFRFIAVGDSAYMMQNKATGMFLKAAGTSGSVTLSAHPTLFNVKAVGYGLNVVSARNLTGASQNNLHIQKSGNMLVTWNASAPGSHSALYVEDAGDVADYDGTTFNVELNPGTVTGYCFPVEISVPEDTDAQMWTVNGVNALDEDSLSLSISLAKIEGNVAPAGRPFILVYGDTEEYNAEDEADMVVLKHGYAIGAKKAEDDKILKGTFSGGTLGAGLITEGNTIVVNKRSTTIPANGVYMTPGWAVSTSATLEVVFDADAADGIQSALQSVSHSGAVYTIDGRLVSKKAGLNDLQKFGKGVYILNGTKVIVK